MARSEYEMGSAPRTWPGGPYVRADVQWWICRRTVNARHAIVVNELVQCVRNSIRGIIRKRCIRGLLDGVGKDALCRGARIAISVLRTQQLRKLDPLRLWIRRPQLQAFWTSHAVRSIAPAPTVVRHRNRCHSDSLRQSVMVFQRRRRLCCCYCQL